jgi:hypothetical protein
VVAGNCLHGELFCSLAPINRREASGRATGLGNGREPDFPNQGNNSFHVLHRKRALDALVTEVGEGLVVTQAAIAPAWFFFRSRWVDGKYLWAFSGLGSSANQLSSRPFFQTQDHGC